MSKQPVTIPDTFTLRGALFGEGDPCDYHIRNGRVAEIRRKPTGAPDYGGEDTYITPPLCDIQINGGFGIDLLDPQLSPEKYAELALRLARHGIAFWMPTLVTAAEDILLRNLAVMAGPGAAIIEAVGGAVPIGFHLEGPFISPKDGARGAHPLIHVQPPSIALFRRLQAAAQGKIRYLTLAPEIPGAIPFIRRLRREYPDLIIAVGHHDARTPDITAAAAAGASLCTHVGNAMPLMIHRHHNTLWPQLAEDRLMASFIPDLHHLPPETLKAMIAAKGPKRSILVSDAVTWAGMPPGEYPMFDRTVVKKPHGPVCLKDSELLAGSGIMLLDGVINAWRHAGLTLREAFDGAWRNPLTLFNLPDKAQWTLKKGDKASFMAFTLKKHRKGPIARLEITCFDGKLYSSATFR